MGESTTDSSRRPIFLSPSGWTCPPVACWPTSTEALLATRWRKEFPKIVQLNVARIQALTRNEYLRRYAPNLPSSKKELSEQKALSIFMSEGGISQ